MVRGGCRSLHPPARGLLTHREVQMIPLSQGPQPVEAAPLVIILQELDAACRGSTEPRGLGVRSFGPHCPEGRGLPWAQPSPSDPHTHTRTHTPQFELTLSVF